MSKVRAIVITAALTLLASPAWAIKDPETGLSFPDTTKCGGATAKAAAVGVREATMGIDVYAIVVYVGPAVKGKSVVGSSGCVKIRARFVRDVGLDKIKAAWKKSLKRSGLSASDAKVAKFLGVISSEMKKKREMMMMVKGGTVTHKYMGRSVTITGAAKLATAIKRTYLGSGSPTPTLIKDLKKRGVARP